MEYVYSALLIHKLGHEVNNSKVKEVIEAAGGKADDMKVRALLSALEGVNIDEVIKQAAIPVAAAQPTEEKKESKSEKASEEDEKKAEEAASAGLGALFG